MSTPAVTQPEQFTPEEFAGKIRDKYPGSYDQIPDAELTQKFLTKYPVYRGVVKTQFETDRSPENREGFLKGAWNTVKNIPGGIASAVSDPMGTAIQTGITVADNDAHRKSEGRSGAYRSVAGVGDILGVDARGMEDAADRGDTSGILGHAAGSAAPYVAPLAIEGVARGVGAVAKPIIKAASSIDPDVTGILSPRAASAQRLALRVGKAINRLRPAKPIPIDALSEAAADVHPIDALSEAATGGGPIEGEYVETPQAKPAPSIPFADQVPRTNRMLPESGSVGINAGEYRRGPGEVTPEITGEPNRDILAGGAVRVRPTKQLPAAKLARPITADTIDDAGVNQEMMDRANAEDRAALQQEGREYAERNSADIPKWKRLAMFRAQMAAENVMREAELSQQIPARLTKTPSARAGKAAGTSAQAIPPVKLAADDLTPILEESLRQAKAKKGQPRGD